MNAAFILNVIYFVFAVVGFNCVGIFLSRGNGAFAG